MVKKCSRQFISTDVYFCSVVNDKKKAHLLGYLTPKSLCSNEPNCTVSRILQKITETYVSSCLFYGGLLLSLNMNNTNICQFEPTIKWI